MTNVFTINFKPIEIIAFAVFSVCSFLLLVFDLHWYMPSTSSIKFISEHYIYPVALSFLFILLLDFKIDHAGQKFSELLRTIFSVSVILYCHFVLKLWSAIVNKSRWDDFFQNTDTLMSSIVTLIVFINSLYKPVIERWPNAYHDLFVMMFVFSMFFHSLSHNRRKDFPQLLSVIALILVIGGIAYFMMPANGPFIFSNGTNPWATHIQNNMNNFYTKFVQSNGDIYHENNFIMAMAAMPSLHAAHATALIYFAWIKIRWLGLLYVPIVVFIFTEAIAAKWHYVIDIPVGILVFIFSIYISKVLHK